MDEFAAFVGWDWADKEHQICLCKAGSANNEQRAIKATPEALHEWAAQMRLRFGGKPVAVGIEMGRGGVIWALMAYEHIVLYLINPCASANFRRAFHVSGKKDDPVDADTLCEMVQKHHHKLRAFAPADAATRELGLLGENRRKFVNDKTRVINREGAHLKTYYPQALELAGDLGRPMACAFLERWPTLEAAKRARPATIRQFYLDHHCRSQEKIDKRLELIKQSVPLTQDVAVVEAGRVQTLALVGVVSALIESIALLDERMETVYRDHLEHDWIESFPGVGPVMGPRLLAILGVDRSRFATANELQCFTGVAPITVSSGGTDGSKVVIRRLRRSKFVHQTVVEWAGLFCQFSEWGRAYYARESEAGRPRWAILRSLGFKLLRILFRCWQSRTNYSEETYQTALKLRGSPLAAQLAA